MFAWKIWRFAIACVFLLLLVLLPAVSGILEPAMSGISDLVIMWKATFVVTSSSRQKTDPAISKNNSSIRRGLSFRKKLFVILCSAVRKLNKLSILSLLITNYSSVYSIYLFYLSNYTRGDKSLLSKITLPGWRLLLNLGDTFQVEAFLPHWR